MVLNPTHQTASAVHTTRLTLSTWSTITDYLESLQRPATEYIPDRTKSIIAQNDSPDVGFKYSINPYRGCSHGCSYCYARPTHEYLGFSAGLDFETKVMVKEDAPSYSGISCLGRTGCLSLLPYRESLTVTSPLAALQTHSKVLGGRRRVPAADAHRHKERSGAQRYRPASRVGFE